MLNKVEWLGNRSVFVGLACIGFASCAVDVSSMSEAEEEGQLASASLQVAPENSRAAIMAANAGPEARASRVAAAAPIGAAGIPPVAFATFVPSPVPYSPSAGPIMPGTAPAPTKLYYIWYGNWGTDTAKTILSTFASNLGGSPYWNINTSYYDTTKKHVRNTLTYAGSAVSPDFATFGTALTQAKITTIVSNVLKVPALPAKALLPADPNAVYLVLTAPSVKVNEALLTREWA
jgi:hypothetical protein